MCQVWQCILGRLVGSGRLRIDLAQNTPSFSSQDHVHRDISASARAHDMLSLVLGHVQTRDKNWMRRHSE